MAFRGMQISTEQIAEMLQCKSGPVCLPLSLPCSLPRIPSYTVHASPIMCYKTSTHSKSSIASVFDCEAAHVKKNLDIKLRRMRDTVGGTSRLFSF